MRLATRCLKFSSVIALAPFAVSAGQNGPDVSQGPKQASDAPLTQKDTKQSPDSVPPAAEKLFRVTQQWLSNKMSSTGMTADIREIARTKTNGQVEVKYHVFLNGAPKDQTYSLVSWPINAREFSETLKGMSLLEDGLVVCAGRADDQCGDPDKKDDPVDFTFHPAEGEPSRLALISANSKAKVFFVIVPVPILKKDNNCTLEAMRLLPKYELVLIRGTGFQPNENLQFKSRSFDETHDSAVSADDHGEYVSGLLPFVKGKTKGTTEVKLIGANCGLALSFEWGN